MRHAGTFVGRRRDLARLHRHLAAVAEDGRGRLLAVRGRRQVGKSRLLTEFVERSGAPAAFFTAARHLGPRADLERFAEALRASSLPGAAVVPETTAWLDAFRSLAAALPTDRPSIVVVDEVPWLIEGDDAFEGSLQAVWDTALERIPVLLVLVGSDLSMMEALTTYQRPLFGRVRDLVVEPFDVADTARMIDVSPAVAFDAQLVTGGYPRLCLEWRGAPHAMAFVHRQMLDEGSDLIGVGRSILAAEFPPDLQARRVLGAIGSGERTNKSIADRASIQASPLARSIEVLRDAKRLVASDVPVSVKASREPRYRVADPYLRFWLRFVESGATDVARGRPDLAVAAIDAGWPAYRGRAVEPLVRASLDRLAASDERLGGAGHVGGWWNRPNTVEVDLVGVDRWPDARTVAFVGSVKWRDRKRFSVDDVQEIRRSRQHVPGGADAPVVGVSRSGFADGLDLAASLGPADLLAAWEHAAE